ncbi:MAG: PCRF domain-containing protein, partial [Candidatus Omnitrophica bacterium]|nr:PCRF domain-containing protein [Candidatus Omnitrophota bacterium]
MLIEQFQKIKSRIEELEEKLSDPHFFKDRQRYQATTKELARLKPLLEHVSEYERVDRELAEIDVLLKARTKDQDLLKLYEEERGKLLGKRTQLEAQLEEKLLDGADPNRDKSIIVEIRAGTGGEEAALFARDLFRMYQRFMDRHGLAMEVIGTNPTGKGGFKEVIFGVSGEGAYEQFRFESGTHRVQRVPETEASGRIHTSAATVAVLP